jgi:hypothetical protein
MVMGFGAGLPPENRADDPLVTPDQRQHCSESRLVVGPLRLGHTSLGCDTAHAALPHARARRPQFRRIFFGSAVLIDIDSAHACERTRAIRT